jgi:SAM-dependent methyltransferase
MATVTETPPRARDLVGPEYAELAAAFDRFAPEDARWRRRNSTYHRLIEQITRFHVPPGLRVLEIGCGSGDLLAALRPSHGVGVDVSAGMVALARQKHPGLHFERTAGERLDLGETFDVIVLSDLVPFVHDLLALFERVAAHSHPRTRVVVNSYSRIWRPVIRLAERLRLKPVKPMRNWVTPEDVRNLLELSGFEVLTRTARVLTPKRIPLLTLFLNGFLATLWPFNRLCLTYWIVARPQPALSGSEPQSPSVSVVCPCRNEAGNVGPLIERLPALGPQTELVFVEGGSTDDTRAEIVRQIDRHPELDISLVEQPGRGKGDAVRAGFAAAKHDVLMILDGDLSVRPEDLPKFYRAVADGRGELINGSRLVYDVEPGAMRFLNMVGNKAFSRLFRAVTGQHVKDTLCGTKVLRRRDYERIAAARSYFGEFDPFGDFDLLFGAARLNLKIVDLPVRYQPRTYGATNISRWRHGWLLLRMTAFTFWKFRVALFTRRAG